MTTTHSIPNGFPGEEPVETPNSLFDMASLGHIGLNAAPEDVAVAQEYATTDELAEQSGMLTQEWTKDTLTERLRTPALHEEIAAMRARGYDVTVGETPDQAYERPDKVIGMYERLHALGKEFRMLKAGLAIPRAGRIALNLPLPGRQSRKEARRNYEATLERYRTSLIYDETAGHPWHDQRGCATALLTITGAHELAVGDQPGYPTMSGMLDKSVMNYTFEGNSLNGLSLREAMIATGQRYRGKSRESAARFADRQLEKLETFLDAPSTQEFKDVVQYCTDSLGIRSRKEEVGIEIDRYIDARLQKDPSNTDVLMMSVGCGTALPMLEKAATLKANKGINPRLILLDQDPIALAAAVQLARKLGLEDNIEVHCERLFNKFGKPLDMSEIIAGRKLDIAEDSGLREYLPKKVYVALTKQIWNSLSDGGLMTTGNMNINRPQPEFLDGVMGWLPKVQMRSIQEGVDLHHQAGVPKHAIRMRVTQDGVYTLYFSSKGPQSA